MYAPLPQKGMETGMKKFRIWILAALAAALCLLCGCSAEDFALPHEVQLAVGQQCALAGELRFTGSLSDITPQDRAEFAQAVTDAVVHIASTDPSVAAVDQDGNVTAVTPGTATVLVSCVDLDFYAEVNINVVPRRKAQPSRPRRPPPRLPPKRQRRRALRRRPRKQLQHLKARFLSPRRLLPSRPRKQPRRRMLNPQRLKLLLLQRPLSPESAAPATPESAATPETAKTATPETAAPPKMPRATEAPAATREETTAADEKTREPFREFLKKAGSTVANFFGGLFDKSTG